MTVKITKKNTRVFVEAEDDASLMMGLLPDGNMTICSVDEDGVSTEITIEAKDIPALVLALETFHQINVHKDVQQGGQ